MRCPHCDIDQAPGGRFCEDCGAPLAVAPPAASPVANETAQTCAQCGAGPEAVDSDGYCSRCGFQRVAPARDHLEIALSPDCGGVSDRGKRHPDNQDFLALASDKNGDVLVICDGVSTSQNAAAAAEGAATAARATLIQSSVAGAGDGRAIMAAAVRAARDVVAALPYVHTDATDPPETTLVAALRQGRTVTLGWLGDSRAYLLTAESVQQLTEDHSWLNEVLAAGELSLAEALKSPRAHYITRTLGGPTGPNATPDEPSLAVITLPEAPGWLLLCSDGLWNYVPEAADLAALVRQQPDGTDALSLARSLVNYACGRGGHDNVTVAALRF